MVGPVGRRGRRGRITGWCAGGLGLVLALTAVGWSRARAQESTGQRPWLDTSVPIEQRITQLMAAMTLEDKAQELYGVAPPSGQYSAGYVQGNPRLGIPPIVLSDGPAGLKDPRKSPVHRPATALPAPVALAATWDPALARAYGSLIGREARARGVDVVYGPTANLVRVPQGGRDFEFLGEDPQLAAQLIAPYVQGLQGHHVAAQVKHFLLNDQENGRTTTSSDASTATIENVYLAPFRAAIVQGGAWSVMCAFNAVNGTPSCENSYLLTGLLRDKLHFAGFVGSDYQARQETVKSLAAGLDQSFTPGNWGMIYRPLPDLVRNGTVPQAQLDTAVRRVLRMMFSIGMFDGRPKETADQKAGGLLARQIAERSTVLLKNASSVLPLSAAKLHSIAVIGKYAATASPGGTGSAQVKPYYTVSPVTAIKQRAGSKVAVSTSTGTNIAASVAQARRSDVAVVVVNDQEGEGHDRSGIELPGNQNALVKAVAAANRRTVVVVDSGAPVTMPWLPSVPAVLEAWYPGEEDGSALAHVLFGDVDPGGRLPVTFPVSLAKSPMSGPPRYPAENGHYRYTEGALIGHRWYESTGVQPLFRFGQGLSYTTFRLSHPTRTPTGGLAVTVTNVGSRAGQDVVQAYDRSPDGSRGALRGFTHVSLAAGESRQVSITAAVDQVQQAARGPADALVFDGMSAVSVPSR